MRKLVFMTLALLAVSVIACSSQSDNVIARVGNQEIILDQVRDFDKMFQIVFPSADSEFNAKKRFLDSLIDVRLLVIGGYQNDLDIDREVMDIVEIQKPKFALDELFKREILPRIKITDAEVEDFYEKLKEEVHVKHIVVDRQSLIDSIYDLATKKGAEFEQLAKEHSLDQNSAYAGGDLGFVRWGQVIDDFQNEVFRLSPGQISKPFATGSGWHIVKMVERRESDPGPFERAKFQIMGMLQDRKRQVVMGEYMDQLRSKYEVSLDEQTYSSILELSNKMFPDSLGGKHFKKTTIDLNILQPFQKKQILAHFKGGEISVEEYLQRLESIPINQRPELKDSDGIKAAVFSMKLESFLRAEAQSQGLDKSAEFETVLKSFREDVMADRMRTLVTEGLPDVVDNDIYSYYDSHPNDFDEPQQYRAREIQVVDRAVAESLRTLIDRGEDFGKLASENTVRPGLKERQGDLGFFYSYKYPALYGAASSMRVGDVRGPIEDVNGNWSIIKMEEIKPPRTKKVEEVAAQIKNLIMYERQLEAVKKWLETKRKETPIEADYDMIWRTIDKDEYDKG